MPSSGEQADNHPRPDAGLGASLARADRAAFDRLHARLAGAVRSLYTRRGLPLNLAEELSQQAWAAMWEALTSGRYDPERSSPVTYLYAIAHRIWLRYLRDRGNSPATECAEEPLSADAEPAEASDLAAALHAVRSALEQPGELSETDRTVLRLSAEGVSDRELGKRLGVAASSAHEARRGAFERLRRALARQGILPDSAERPGGGRQ
ncbi:MAG: sigma-70 family RNA polymerase sigma factor [Phycisphaerales bacterium]